MAKTIELTAVRSNNGHIRMFNNPVTGIPEFVLEVQVDVMDASGKVWYSTEHARKITGANFVERLTEIMVTNPETAVTAKEGL